MSARRQRLVTPRFAVVTFAGLAYFVALGVVLPVLPHYVEDELHGGDVAVGIAVGAFALGAVLLRPWAGRLGDSIGRRALMVGGALIVGVSIAMYSLTSSLASLSACRFLTGVGEAAFFVGAATTIADMAPVERRGEAVSYFSVAVYGGLAFGPVIGETVLDHSHFDRVWLTATVLALLASVLGLAVVDPPRASVDVEHRHLLHRAALGPGTVLALGLVGLAGFTAFLPLYVTEIGLTQSRFVFLLYGTLILAVRIVGARLPDVLGPIRAGTAALSAGGAGLLTMAAIPSLGGLLAGTVIFAAGMSLLFPALLTLALTGIGEHERASVVGTFSTFFDLSQGTGALILGVVAETAGYRGAFAAGGLLAFVGLVTLRTRVDAQRSADPSALRSRNDP
ncbi:MAG: MFS transporter [Acidimicrobiia bacterium]